MLPYTVIKEANPPALSGTATGVVNFINFTFSALLGPVFGRLLISVSGGAAPMTLEHYQSAFTPLLYGVGLAIILTLLLERNGTGRAPGPGSSSEFLMTRDTGTGKYEAPPRPMSTASRRCRPPWRIRARRRRSRARSRPPRRD